MASLNRKIVFFALLTAMFSGNIALSQIKSHNGLWKWSTWALLQSLPSASLYEDRDESGSSLKFGLEWQVIPFSYSFSTNKYVSPVNFFFIRPQKRFSGSAELFFQPEYMPGGFKHSGLKNFMFKSGTRIVLPLAQKGEYLCYSLGFGYYYSRTLSGGLKDGIFYEAGVYSVFGMLGLKFAYKQNSPSRFSFSLYIKYY